MQTTHTRADHPSASGVEVSPPVRAEGAAYAAPAGASTWPPSIQDEARRVYLHGLRLGLRSLLRGRLTRRTAALLVSPVNYWRMVEYGLTLRELAPEPSDVILDIGSPKLLSMYLAETYRVEIHPTDIEDYFVDDYIFHRSMFPEELRERIHPSVQDGRRLGFEDRTFTKVYSISVLEHIPGEGDSACVKEIGRVLKPGGRCVLTVPFAPAGFDQYRTGGFYWAGSSVRVGDQVFFQRRYSEADLHRRLVEPSGMKLTKIEYVGERTLTWSERELGEFIPPVIGPLHPLLARLFLTEPHPDWRRLRKPLCALVVMEKRRP